MGKHVFAGLAVFVFIAFSVACMTPAAIAAAPNIVYVSPLAKSAKLGSNFSVDIAINATDYVFGAEFALSFNSSLMEAFNATEGAFLKQGWIGTYGIVNISNQEGTIRLASTRIGTTSGVRGTGALFMINFTAKSLGTGSLAFMDSWLLNSTLARLNADVVNGTIIVNQPPVINSVQVRNSYLSSADSMKCEFNVTDSYPSPKANVMWFRNRRLWSEDGEEGIDVISDSVLSTSEAGNIESDDTFLGDSWVCMVTAYNDLGSSTKNSSAAGVKTIVSVSPESSVFFPNMESVVNITIDTQENMFAGDLVLKYDPSMLNLTQASEGEFLRKWASTYAIITPNASAGEVRFAITRIGTATGVTGNGVFATLKFRPLSSNNSEILLKNLAFTNTSIRPVFAVARNGFANATLFIGDINGDCIVNIVDLATAGLAFNSKPGWANWNPKADVNRDGKVDILDLAAVGLNYGKRC